MTNITSEIVKNENTEDVEALIEGSHLAFSKIYMSYHRPIFLFALRYLKSRELAEDAAQYTFMRLWETHEDIQIEYGVKPYLYSILKNHLLNTYKHQQMILEKNEEIILSMPLFAEENILQSIYKKQREEAIRKALDLLPEQRRKICELKIYDGLSNTEVAQNLNITVNTVKVSYYKALLLLRERLNEKDFTIILMLFLNTLSL